MKKLFLTLLLSLFLVSNAWAVSATFLDLISSGSSCSYSSQDFTTYTENDNENDITVIAAKVSWVNYDNSGVTGRVTKDFSAGYFDGDFTVRFKAQYNNADPWGVGYFFGITNTDSELKAIATASGDYQGFSIYDNTSNERLELVAVENGAESLDAFLSDSPTTVYYITITRDDDGGTNNTGQLKAYICTTAYCTSGGNLQDTLSVDCAAGEQNDFRYMLVAPGYDIASGSETDGYVEDMKIKLCID